MTKKAKEIKKLSEQEQKIHDLTRDLQRTRADFENYRKCVESDRLNAHEYGQTSMILKLLPVIDNIERAISYIPDNLKNDKWAQGVVGLVNNLEKSLNDMGIKRIDAKPGTIFNPDLHEAILLDEKAEGDSPNGEEVIAEEMQPGYMLGNRPIRHSMVKVTRK